MRLLKLNSDGGFSLETFSRATIPPYAILSHTWGKEDEEIAFRDLIDGTGGNKKGYQKLQFCGNQAKADDLHYFWVDTCCIDKTNNGELTSAINSMFRWYQKAARCYVYLSNVSIRTQDGQSLHVEWESAFRNSRWFRRGWTLQELLAPKVVTFYSRDHVRLGDKTSLERQIHEITGIALEALQGRPLSDFSVEERFIWGAERQTTEEEDMAYCLLGIFNIYLPLIYGEGQSNAMRRLRKEIKESANTRPHSTNSEPPRIMPFGRNPRFTGRESELSKLEKLLLQSSQTTNVAIMGQSSLSCMVEHIEKVCNCRQLVVQQSSRRIFPGLEIFSRIAISHRQDCPYSRNQKVTKKLGLNIIHVSKLIGAVMQASFTLQFGAGDLSISPYLAFRGFSRKNSPAFTLFNELGWAEAETLPQYISILRQISTRLHLLFTNGEASPNETDEFGETLLHQAMYIMSGETRSALVAHPHFIAEKNILLKSLSSLGVPLNELSYFGKCTFLDSIIWESCHHEGAASSGFIRDLTDLGAEFANNDWEEDWTRWFDISIYWHDRDIMKVALPRRMVESMQTVSEFAEECGCTGLEFAILSKSKSKVASIVARDPEAVSYENLVGQTPLHMAANWPWALQFLLDSGADVSAVDGAGILPLSYACFFGCHEAVKILLAAESPLSSAFRKYTVLDDASTIRDVSSFALVATTLAQRRIQVLDIARSVLPIHTLDNIIQSRKGILDTESGKIIQALQKPGVRMDPHYLCFTDRSVYHTENLLPDTAELLYNLGFSNVEGRDKRRLTPLASVIDGGDSKVKIVPWLVSKGADVHQWLKLSIALDHDLKAVHFAAAGIGDNLCHIFATSWQFGCTPFQRFNDHGIDAIRVILGSGSTNCYDHCNCLCSTKGCSPLTMILKGFAKYMRPPQETAYPYRKWSKFRTTTVDWILEIDGLDPPTKRGIGLEALRMLLFDEMDLTHTCCRSAFRDIKPPMDYEEALEVTDEEADIILQFETLYDRAELEWKGSSELFSRFLRKFIHENISHRRCEQRIDNGYAQALRDIGVQLQEASDDEDSTISAPSDESDHTQFTVSGEAVKKGSGTADTLRNGTAVNEVLEAEEFEDVPAVAYSASPAKRSMDDDSTSNAASTTATKKIRLKNSAADSITDTSLGRSESDRNGRASIGNRRLDISGE